MSNAPPHVSSLRKVHTMGWITDLRRMMRPIKPEQNKYTLGLTSLFGVNLCDVLAPVFMAVAVDIAAAAFTGKTPETPPLLSLVGLQSTDFTVLSAALLYLALQVGANIFRYPMLMLVAVPSHQIAQNLRNRFVQHLSTLSQPFYDRSKSGDLMSLATADINAVRMFYGPGILVGADVFMIVSLVLLVLFGLSWELTLITILPLPIIALFTNTLSHLEYKRFEAVQDDLSKLTERARESYAGIQILQGYAREEHDRARFRDFSWRHYVKNIQLARVRSLFDPTLDLMLGLSTILVLIFGGLQVSRGTMTLGTFVAFLFLVRYLSGPMIGFGWAVTLLQRGRASFKRLDTFFEEPIDIQDHTGARDHGPAKGDLKVQNLTFKYEQAFKTSSEDDKTKTSKDASLTQTGENAPTNHAPALKEVSLHVPAGTTLGIIGPVGSGKTTLVSLLVRLYDAPTGSILLDDTPVTDWTLSALRRDIVLAPQDTFLFGDTVARNMTLSDPTTSEDPKHLRSLAQLAHLHNDLDELPLQYETLLGERGVNLSGGQRQRLAIARAIGADPRVLILDDCLSAVDARTEGAILDNLDEVFQGRTGVIVSHRVIAVRRCDLIVVLEDGRITAQGTHDELLQNPDSYYARVAREQTRDDHTPRTEVNA